MVNGWVRRARRERQQWGGQVWSEQHAHLQLAEEALVGLDVWFDARGVQERVLQRCLCAWERC